MVIMGREFCGAVSTRCCEAPHQWCDSLAPATVDLKRIVRAWCAASEADAKAPGQVPDDLQRGVQMQALAFQALVRTRPPTTPTPVVLVTRRVPVPNTDTIATGRVTACQLPSIMLTTCSPAPSSPRILSYVEWLIDKFNLDLFLWLRGWAVVQLPEFTEARNDSLV